MLRLGLSRVFCFAYAGANLYTPRLSWVSEEIAHSYARTSVSFATNRPEVYSD